MLKKIAALRGHQIVCGYGRIGKTVCRTLAKRGVQFVVIERNEELVELATEDGHLALRGDATSDSSLSDAGIDHAAGLLAVTNSDTENLVITIAAHEHSEELPIISRAEGEEAVARMKPSRCVARHLANSGWWAIDRDRGDRSSTRDAGRCGGAGRPERPSGRVARQRGRSLRWEDDPQDRR